MEAFCRDEGIPFDICGKVIVAVTADDLRRSSASTSAAWPTACSCEMIDRDRLKELEPHAARRAGHPRARGRHHRLSASLRSGWPSTCGAATTGRSSRGPASSRMHTAGDEVQVETTAGTYAARYVVNCAGLQCDRVTAMTRQQPAAKIVPFRGEYFELKPEAATPVPQPDLSHARPGVSVSRRSFYPHGARRSGMRTQCGAGLRPRGLSQNRRQPARPGSNRSRIPGFLQLAAKYWRTGLGEMWRSVSKQAFVRATATASARDPRRASGRGAGRRACAGPIARRQHGRRFS